MKRILIIVDIQNDFCEGGALAVDGGNATAAKVASYVRDHHRDYDVIVATQDWHVSPGGHFASAAGVEPDYITTWPDHCVANTMGAALHPEIQDVLYYVDAIFRKGQYSASYSGFDGVASHVLRLDEYVDRISLDQYIRQHASGDYLEIDIVGIAFDYCVAATAIGAKNFFKNADVKIMKVMTASVNPDNDDDETSDLEGRFGIKVER